MARKKKATKQQTFTLKEAIEYINSLANADNSKRNWRDALATLVYYNEVENPYPTILTKAEMAEQYGDVNIAPLLLDFDKIVDIVEQQIKSSRDGKPIAIDTIKSYYLAIVRATQKGSPFQLPKQTKDKYNDKVKEFDTASNDARNLNKPKKANISYPNFSWSVVQKEYDDYVSSHAFTRTMKGRRDIRIACIAGLYVLQRPRRVMDYATLQFFSKKPSEKEAEDRNILYIDDDKMYVSIDKFKTRFRVSGASKQAKELLPRYVKEVNSKLADLFKKYITLFDIKDMSKLNNQERRAKKEYYIFFQEGTSVESNYDENTFSKVISNAFKIVFGGRKGITVNSLRHVFNTWISENLQQFTDGQLMEIAIDCGDTPRNLPTNLRYRIANQENADLNKTEIEGLIHDDEYAKNLRMADVGENASVGNVEEERVNIDDGEVISPPPLNINNDSSLDELYMQLGKAYFEVERIKLIIARKLGVL